MWLWKRQITPINQEEMIADLEEAKPVIDDIRNVLTGRHVTGWVAIVALSTLLGEAVAGAMAKSAMKGYLRFAHRSVDSAFWAMRG